MANFSMEHSVNALHVVNEMLRKSGLVEITIDDVPEVDNDI